MTQEQKAKAYDEAIERAKTLYNSVFVNNDILEQIFPELAESEDERIRQRIIKAIRLRADDMNEEWSDEIAWLEKQKEPDGTWTEEDDAKVKVMCKEGDLKPSERAWLKELKNRIVKKEQKPEEIDEYKIIKKHITEDSLSSEVNKRLTECGWYVSDEKPEEWSKVDEAIIGCIVCCLDGQFVTEAARKQCLEWFNRHRKDFLNQPKQEWSKEDEENEDDNN